MPIGRVLKVKTSFDETNTKNWSLQMFVKKLDISSKKRKEKGKENI